MIFILAHFVFFVFGLTAVIQNKVSLSKDTAIVGRPARLIGCSPC